MRTANYTILEETPEKVVIRDVGPWDHFQTVTNAAEDVVSELWKRGKLGPRARLLYYDTEGTLDELCHEGGNFTGFAPGPRI